MNCSGVIANMIHHYGIDSNLENYYQGLFNEAFNDGLMFTTLNRPVEIAFDSSTGASWIQ